VPGLSLPDPGSLPPAEELTNFEAVRLFLERAREAHSGFALTEQNAPPLARLSRKLDGIPLAIELAAARTRVLTVEQILERLEDPLALLTSGSRVAAPRHQTLRATLQWSYELLSDQGRALLDRFSVFAGGWTLGAAEAVGTGGSVMAERVLDLLSELVEKSLVVVEDSPADAGALRYGMLEPIRQFGREKLEENGEAPEARLRHAEHYMALAETAEPELLGPDQDTWLQRLRVEFGNLRAALSWSLQPDGDSRERADELRLRLVAALWRFWDVEGFEEGKQWLQTALERDPGGFPAVRANALGGLGFILLFQQDYGPAIAALEEAVALYKELGDRSGAAFALASLGWAVLHGFYHERVPAFLRESEALIEGGLEGPPVLTWVSCWPPPRSGRVTSTWRPPGSKRPSPCAGSWAT
jgi:predicted ATPase